MTVATTTWFELVAALLVKFRADTTIVTTYSTDVRDGPKLATELTDTPNLLFVGAQPSREDTGEQAGGFNQNWGELGARARYEDVTVLCELVVQAGSADLDQRRVVAMAILAAVEIALRTDFTLSIGRLMWCHIVSGTPRQTNDQNGTSVVVPFTIAGRARLASQ